MTLCLSMLEQQRIHIPSVVCDRWQHWHWEGDCCRAGCERSTSDSGLPQQTERRSSSTRNQDGEWQLWFYSDLERPGLDVTVNIFRGLCAIKLLKHWRHEQSLCPGSLIKLQLHALSIVRTIVSDKTFWYFPNRNLGMMLWSLCNWILQVRNPFDLLPKPSSRLSTDWTCSSITLVKLKKQT